MPRQVTNVPHVAGAQVESAGYRFVPQTMRPDFPGKSGLATEGLHQPGHGVPRQAIHPRGGAIEPAEERSRGVPPRFHPVGQGGAGRSPGRGARILLSITGNG